MSKMVLSIYVGFFKSTSDMLKTVITVLKFIITSFLNEKEVNADNYFN